jgi:hypothetical protein
MPDTTYIVLRRKEWQGASETSDDTTPTWLVVNEVQAPGAEFAIRESVFERSGTYVAVPARSWKPVTVTTETRTILKLEQPDPAA